MSPKFLVWAAWWMMVVEVTEIETQRDYLQVGVGRGWGGGISSSLKALSLACVSKSRAPLLLHP